MRNAFGIDWNNDVNELYATVHGRDMLFQHYPAMYNQKQGAELPSETFYRVKKEMILAGLMCIGIIFKTKKY